MTRVSDLRALAYTAGSSRDSHVGVELARLLPHLTAVERRDWCWVEIWNAERRRRVHAAHGAARGNSGPAAAAAAQVDLACWDAVEWDDHRATHPRVTAWPARRTS